MTELQVGDVRAYKRTFTVADVRAFADISGDRGRQHIEPGPDGRVWVHGLLTATIPTKLGGDLNYLARTMTFEFVRPVFSGDEIECRATITKAEKQPGRSYYEMEIVCTNQLGKDVLRATTAGVVLDPAPADAPPGRA
jgi:acyl dehydratase